MCPTTLTERGWDEPLNESPFDLPENWTGGAVVNTGGHVYCRIWRDKSRDLRVIYNLHDPGIAVERIEYDDDLDMYIFDEVVSTPEAPSGDDTAKIRAARNAIHLSQLPRARWPDGLSVDSPRRTCHRSGRSRVGIPRFRGRLTAARTQRHIGPPSTINHNGMPRLESYEHDQPIGFLHRDGAPWNPPRNQFEGLDV